MRRIAVQGAAGCIVLALLDGEFTVKRYRPRNGRILLQAENPAFPEIEITEERAFEVWGVVMKPFGCSEADARPGRAHRRACEPYHRDRTRRVISWSTENNPRSTIERAMIITYELPISDRHLILMALARLAENMQFSRTERQHAEDLAAFIGPARAIAVERDDPGEDGA
jgi:hypothetical protein